MAEPDALLDTNTVILLPQLVDASSLGERPTISTITLAELSVGPHVATDPVERASRQAQVQQAERDFEPLPFDDAAARAFGRIATDLRSAGRKTSARAFDALIAAVAVSRELPLHTVNPDDFRGINGLDVHAVPHPDT
jgi:tRNA(fMet)-specific endonuclease VapC